MPSKHKTHTLHNAAEKAKKNVANVCAIYSINM